jgi:hypothetical protein
VSDTALLTEPLVGWRLWHVAYRKGEPCLASWSRSAVWPAASRMEARCWLGLGGGVLRAEHEAPRLGHSCGLYALRTRARAEALLREIGRVGVGSGRRPVALGRVSLWGRVIENVDGFRAQYAYPYDLELVGGDEPLAAALRTRYAVDVTAA